MRKNTRIRLGVFVGMSALAAGAVVAGPASASSNHRASDRECGSLVGSWKVVDDNTGEVFLGSYHGGPSTGTVNFSSPNNTTTLSHGEWKQTGDCTYSDTDTALLLGEDGKANSTITFKANITVKTQNTATFDFQFQINKLDGTPVTSGASTGAGTRIDVQPRTAG